VAKVELYFTDLVQWHATRGLRVLNCDACLCKGLKTVILNLLQEAKSFLSS